MHVGLKLMFNSHVLKLELAGITREHCSLLAVRLRL